MVPKRPSCLFIDRILNPQGSPDLSPASVGKPAAARFFLPVSPLNSASSVCESPAMVQPGKSNRGFNDFVAP